MEMESQEGRRCVTCGLEIGWPPVMIDSRPYCCGGCALGGPCYCSYDPPQAGSSQVASELPATTVALQGGTLNWGQDR